MFTCCCWLAGALHRPSVRILPVCLGGCGSSATVSSTLTGCLRLRWCARTPLARCGSGRNQWCRQRQSPQKPAAHYGAARAPRDVPAFRRVYLHKLCHLVRTHFILRSDTPNTGRQPSCHVCIDRYGLVVNGWVEFVAQALRYTAAERAMLIGSFAIGQYLITFK